MKLSAREKSKTFKSFQELLDKEFICVNCSVRNYGKFYIIKFKKGGVK